MSADDLIAEAKKWLESAGHNGGPPARLLAALVERVSRQPQEGERSLHDLRMQRFDLLRQAAAFLEAPSVSHQPVDAPIAPVVVNSQQEPPKELRERLAALAHEQWSGWMRYLFGRCYFTPDGAAFMEVPDTKRWQRQMNAPYAELPEAEKESDRKEADRVLALLSAAVSHQQEPPTERERCFKAGFLAHSYMAGVYTDEQAWQEYEGHRERMSDPSPAAEGQQEPPQEPALADAAEMLWVVLANVSGGDWTQQSPEWQEVAARWRDNYFAALKADTAAAKGRQQEPPQEQRLRQALKEIRYMCRDVELGNWFAPDAIEQIIVTCESVDDQPATNARQQDQEQADRHAPDPAPAPAPPSPIACPILQSQVAYAIDAAITEHAAQALHRDPCGCVHDGTAIVHWCRRSAPVDRAQDPQD